jgi:trehalose 6-phosphate synthase/phosphatase
MSTPNRLVIVSNRLPVTIEHTPKGVVVNPSSGGLVAALLPLFKSVGGVWIGWPGADYAPEIASALRSECSPDSSFEPVFLTPPEMAHFYNGCCNEIVWPLFHDLQSRCNFNSMHWSVYRDVNEKFADAVERTARRDDFVWVHDYQLMMLADCLRARGIHSMLAYFHHIPFPAADVFEKLPWRKEVLRGLLQFNRLGFQTDRDRRNFVGSLRRCLGAVRVRRVGQKYLVAAEGCHVEIATYPISIDFQALSSDAAHPQVDLRVQEIRRKMGDQRLVLGVDRLDFTKGISQRLIAFRALLENRPELRGRVTLVQLIVPSREQIAAYRDCRAEVEKLVSQINGEFGRPGWSPVNYLHRHVSRQELLALYGAADVALVTPVKDGMNLVAKEFCASRNDERGVLVLSEFAGAVAELHSGALLVNPYDAEGLASALHQALKMPYEEQKMRMQRMRHVIRMNDVFTWCRSICGHLAIRKEQPELLLTERETQSLAQAV